MDFVESVKLFNNIAGTNEVYNEKMISLYMGLILEEVGEMLTSLNIPDEGLQNAILNIENYSQEFKKQNFDVSKLDRVAFLDGAVDVAVVSLGAGISNGANVTGATMEVANSNLSKFPLVDGEYVVLKDENGKIMKPASYYNPSLAQYLHDRLG